MNKFTKIITCLTILACCIAIGTAEEVKESKVINISEVDSYMENKIDYDDMK